FVIARRSSVLFPVILAIVRRALPSISLALPSIWFLIPRLLSGDVIESLLLGSALDQVRCERLDSSRRVRAAVEPSAGFVAAEFDRAPRINARSCDRPRRTAPRG